MNIYKCDTCNKEISQEDKCIIKIVKADGKSSRRDIETCVFCIVKGLVLTDNLVKVQDVETKEKVG